MSARILLVEDDPLVRDLLALNLRHAGFEVTVVSTIADAQRSLADATPALGILDLMLPDGDGFSLVQDIRARKLAFPILMLTARNEQAAKIRGLDAGADDYLTKPFDIPEVLARVRALLRRATGAEQAVPLLSIGRFWVRFDIGRALTNEGEVTLSDKELGLMRVFADNQNCVFSRADLIEEVWGMDASPTDRTVDNFIMHLRRFFEEDPEHPTHFVTVRGQGYMFRG